MRTGAIFARGSCRALKWMALFGVVFALGVGVTQAQDVTKVELNSYSLTEGGTATVTITVGVAAGVTTAGSYSVDVAVVSNGNGIDVGEGVEVTGDNRDVRILTGNPLTVPYVASDKGKTVTGTVQLAFGHDLDAENEKFYIEASIPIGTKSKVKTPRFAEIDDLQEQEYKIEFRIDKDKDPDEVTSVREGQQDVQVRLIPDPARTIDVSYEIRVDDLDLAAYIVEKRTGTWSSKDIKPEHRYAQVDFLANDRDRDDDTATVTVVGGSAAAPMNLGSKELKVNDIHMLPKITAEWTDKDGKKSDPQPDMAKEGAELYLELTVDRKGADGDVIATTVEALEIKLVPQSGAGMATTADYTLGSITDVAAGAENHTTTAIKLTLAKDVDVSDEMLVFDATVTGEELYGGSDNEATSPMVLSITIDDQTSLNITAKSDEDVKKAYDDARDMVEGADGLWSAARGEEGDKPLEIALGALFNLPESGFTISGDARSSDIGVVTADADGSRLMVTPKSDGTATVTVTASTAASSVQISPDIATVEIMVTVDKLPSVVTVSTDPMGSVEEGGTLTVTATLNQMAPHEKTIDLDVNGPVEGDDHSVMIMEGKMSGYTMLMVMDDDRVSPMSDIVIVASTELEGVTVTPRTLTLSVTEDDMETTYELIAAADSVMEGDEVEINVTASQPVAENTVITLMHGAGSASADDYTVRDGDDVGTMLIEAGSDTGGATFKAIADGEVEGDETLTLNGMIGNLVVDSVMLTITDIDEPEPVVPTVRAKDGAAMMIADAIATAAGGSDWMVGGMVATVNMSMLFEVDEGVTASYSGKSSNEDVVSTVITGGTMLNLTPAAAGSATITVTASDLAGGGGPATVTHDAVVALQTLMIDVEASADWVDEGGSVTLTAMANRAVTAETTLDVTVTGADADAVSADETITIAMGAMSGTATVMAVEDADSADANVTVVVSGGGLASPVTIAIAITDNDSTVTAKSPTEVTAVFVIAVAMAGGADGWLPGGDAASVDMSELFTPNGSPTLEYMVESSAPEMVETSASGSMLTLTPMATGDATITVTATDTSGDMYDTAEVMSMVTVGVLPLEITVSPETAEITEGESVEITAMLNKMVDSNVEVMLLADVTASTADDGDDYTVTPSMMITIMAGKPMGKATLMAVDDYMVEDTESVTLVARHKDMGDIGTVMVSIMDNDMETTYTLTGPMDMNIVEGMSYELTAEASQMVRMDTEVMIVRDRAASDADDDDYMVESIMIPSGAMSGTTMLMVTEDNMPDGGTGTNMGESLVLIGSVDGMEIDSLTFTIWDAAVPALPLIAQLLLAAFLAIGGYRRYLRR